MNPVFIEKKWSALLKCPEEGKASSDCYREAMPGVRLLLGGDRSNVTEVPEVGGTWLEVVVPLPHSGTSESQVDPTRRSCRKYIRYSTGTASSLEMATSLYFL